MSTAKVILITGASSGNGKATAELLSQRGNQVFGTSRNPAASNEPSTFKLLPLDVRSDDSVAECVNSVLEQAGRIDVLVNNAGYELGGALEEISLDEARAQFETNFFGVMRMTKAVLSGMRQRKDGQIINIGSLSGIAPVPFLGIYSASKFALEGYSEALFHEVQPFNIRVSIIEAGFLKTPLMEKRQMAAQMISDYDTWRQRAMKSVREYEETGSDAHLVADTVLQIIESKSPQLRYIIGQQAKSIFRFRRFLPESMFNSGSRRTFKLDGK